MFFGAKKRLKKQSQNANPRRNTTLDDAARDGIFHDDESTKI
jgi:hypothetical protein